MDNLEQSKQAYTLLRAELEGMVAGCECADGEIPIIEGDEYLRDDPCPTCQPWRTLLKEWCWLPLENYGCCTTVCSCCELQSCPSCEYCNKQVCETRGNPLKYRENPANPDLTHHRTGSKLTLVVMLERAGLLDGFSKWHEWQHIARLYDDWIDHADEHISVNLEILTDGENLLPAVIAYMEGRVK